MAKIKEKEIAVVAHEWSRLDLLIFFVVSFIIIFIASLGIQQMQKNLPQAYSITSTTTTIPQSYYEGTVQAISMNAPGFLSYVQFTTGQKEYGNLSMISNLSVGVNCKLLLNQNISDTFISGACT